MLRIAEKSGLFRSWRQGYDGTEALLRTTWHAALAVQVGQSPRENLRGTGKYEAAEITREATTSVTCWFGQSPKGHTDD